MSQTPTHNSDGQADTVTAEKSGFIKVWDPFVRIGHWVLVGGFLVCYLTEGEPEWLHEWSGYAVAVTVILRVIWGFIGPKYARFSDFVRSPVAALEYMKGAFSGSGKQRFIGHNPAGGLMAVAMLLSLGGATYSGMAMIAAEGEGPLASFMGPQAAIEMSVVAPALADDDEHERQEHGGVSGAGGERGGEGAGEQWEGIHEFFANLTLVLMILHIMGVVTSSLAHKENLVRSMIHGRKRA